MAPYLSAEWFAEVSAGEQAPGGPTVAVLEQVVEGTPEGQVTYRVELAEGGARIVWPVPEGAPGPDLRLTADWPTAVAIAQGQLSAQRALMQGRLRVSGDPGRLAELNSELQGLDPVPETVRRATTYPAAS